MTGISVVVVAWNGEAYIADALRSTLAQQPRPTVLVVDNASCDGTVHLALELLTGRGSSDEDGQVMVQNQNLGFVAGANRGLEQVLSRKPDDRWTLLLNQDAALRPGALAAIDRAFSLDPRIGAVGCRILYPDGLTVQHAGGRLELPRLVGRHLGHGEPVKTAVQPTSAESATTPVQDVDFVTGAALAIRTEALRQVGLLDEAFSPGYYEDVELCDRLRTAGWRVVYAPDATVLHHESASFTNRDERLFLAHRNRYLYAIPRLQDATFRAEFTAAESTFLTNQASFEELRAACRGALAVASRPLLRIEVEDSGANHSRSPHLCARVLFDLRSVAVQAIHSRLVDLAQSSVRLDDQVRHSRSRILALHRNLPPLSV